MRDIDPDDVLELNHYSIRQILTVIETENLYKAFRTKSVWSFYSLFENQSSAKGSTGSKFLKIE